MSISALSAIFMLARTGDLLPIRSVRSAAGASSPAKPSSTFETRNLWRLVCGALLLMICFPSFSASFPQQQISTFSPKSGPIGTVITVTGSGFSGSNSAWVGASHEAQLIVLSDTQARIAVPASGTTGAFAILNAQHAAFSATSFTVTTSSAAASAPQQTISSITPMSGPVGTVITVTGTGFTGSNAAWIGSAHDAAISVTSDTLARVTVSASAKSGQLAVLNSQHAAFSQASFSITSATVASPQPSISMISPTSGPVGTVISVTGKGFTGANTGKVGTATDGALTVVSDTQAQIKVPADAITGTVSILNPQYAASSVAPFTLTASSIPAAVPVSIPGGTMSISVSGSHLVDGKGAVVQLRGVNYSGFESVAIQGWNPADPSGAQAGQAGGPKWSAIKSWKANAVRFPLNEASWLGYSCTDTSGVVHNPDPGSNYKAAVKTQVDQAIAAGLYVILDLHWTAPGNACPMLQTQMADSDHSIAFWISVAGMFKGYPSVMFELFNEPFLNVDFSGDPWAYMMKGTGGSFSGYPATSGSGAYKDVKQPWLIASYQTMINAVRATGATNVVLVGAVSYTQDLSGWLANKPTDPLNQMAATWHPYPTYGAALGSAAYAQPNYASQVFTDAQNILAAGIPLIATETGDHNAAGTSGAPLVSTVTQWADAHGMSLFGWTWDVWGNADNVLIKDVNGTPTDGYGQFYRSWLLAH